MKKLLVLAAFALLAFSPVLKADAAAKKKTPSRSDYTKEQQKKFYDEALKGCRKRFRTSLHFVKVNYRKRQYICYHY